MGIELTAAQWAMSAFGIKALTSVSNFFGGQSQAEAQNKAAWDNYDAQKLTLDQKSKEISQQSANQETERAIQGQIERGKMRTLAGEAGLGGNLIDRWNQDSTMQESKDIASIETNKANQLKQTLDQYKGAYSYAQGQSNVAASKSPSAIGTGLQLVGAGMDYSKQTQIKTPQPLTKT